MVTINIAGEAFPSQRAVRARAGAVLHHYALWSPIHGQDEGFIAALFAFHPRAGDKTGPGIDRFVVAPGEHGPERNLYVVRTDGTTDNFSIKTCVAAAAAASQED